MIVFKTLSWSNAFSYGPNNTLDFTKNPLIQLVGKNGHGKSSIALILEEVLYNKNSKNIKKANIINRYAKAKSYSISLEFSKDGDEYLIETNRGSTQTVKLSKNGKDISSHTSTATYKQIEDIIGYDHKTFCQIVYQSSAFSLEFLKATDTARKKFLIDLLRLSRYTDIAEKIKVDLKEDQQTADLLNKRLDTINSWLSKHEGEDLSIHEIKEVPVALFDEQAKLAEIQEKLRTLKETNKKIIQNNKYIEILNTLHVELLPAPTADIVALKVSLAEIQKRIKAVKAVISDTSSIPTSCPSCGQPVDNNHKKVMREEALELLPSLQAELKLVEYNISEAESEKRKYDAAVTKLQEYERYANLVDKTLSTELLDQVSLEADANTLSTNISNRNKEIKDITASNAAAEAHNAKVAVIQGMLDDMHKDHKKVKQELDLITSKLTSLQILAKTFSPTGFIAYKIESLVKDLEDLTNEYLADMSDGRFQLAFKINSSDKLDVVITDNGDDIDIFALSNGELARVNVSTLLAIRKLMQNLSNTRTNLLILDETIENLDIEGKDKLVEVLLKEESLNTVLVSHSFTHPIITKIEIVKNNKISRID